MADNDDKGPVVICVVSEDRFCAAKITPRCARVRTGMAVNEDVSVEESLSSANDLAELCT